MAVHFTGPILFAGKDGNKKWFENLPIDKNPDYLVYMDDFTGIALDSTNDWTVVKDSSASAAIAADVVNGALTIWFETKITPTDAEGDNQEICIGLTVNFATNPEAMLTAADRIVFQVDDGDSNIDCVTEKDGTATTTDSGIDVASGTAVTLGIHVKGTGSVEFFVNRNLVATHTANIPDDENLALGAMQLSGSATGTKSMNIDYMFAAQNR
jgi:hypothetical protein